MNSQWFIIALLLSPFGMIGLNIIWGFWLDTRPDRMQAVILETGGQLRSHRVKISLDGKSFNFGTKENGQTYSIVRECVYRVGIFRVPTSYYLEDQIEPIDMKSATADSEHSAADYFEATQSNVAKDIIQAFSSPLLNTTTSMMIILFVMVLGGAAIYLGLAAKLDLIIEGLGLVAEIE